jgi:hypothetical protein
LTIPLPFDSAILLPTFRYSLSSLRSIFRFARRDTALSRQSADVTAPRDSGSIAGREAHTTSIRLQGTCDPDP